MMERRHKETGFVEQQVAWHLLQRVYKNETVSSLFILIVSAVLATVMTVYAPSGWVPFLWWLTIGSVVLCRLYSSRRFFATAARDTAPRWKLRYEILTTITGLALGIGGALMYLMAPVAENRTAILVVIALMTVAAVSYQGALLRAYLGYLLGAVLPLSAVMAVSPAATGDLALLTLVYCAAMWIVSGRYNQDVRDATLLGYETQHLTRQLADTNRTLEADIDAKIQAEKLLSTEKNVLENVARQKPLIEVLDEMNLDVEALYPGSLCSVLLLDADTNRISGSSAPSLPESYSKCLEGLETGPNAGSCGTAMYRTKQVIVEDIANDPLWTAYRDLALSHDLRACWSTPIVSPSGDVLGSFAIYRRTPQSPSRSELETVSRMSRLIALVIEDVRISERIRLSEQRFRDFAGAAADWFWEVDPELQYTYVSKKTRESDAWPKDTIMRKTVKELRKTAYGNSGKSNQIDWERIDLRKPLVIEFTASSPDSGNIEVMSIVKPVFDGRNSFSGWRGVGRDVTRERELEREIRYQATHDSLTGLLNRREFDLRIREMLARRPENGEHYVAFIDLDRFKLINDNAGHYAGDAVLKRVAEILSTHMPGEQTVARLGGDEFGASFVMDDPECAVGAMENLVNELANGKFEWGNTAFRLGASVGLVRVTPIYKTSAQVLSDADASCYKAKNQGGNRVSLFQPDLDLFRDDARSTSELIKALKNNRALMHVQPIRAIQKRETTPWYEVLLRYSTDGSAASSPSRFIPAAERYGQMGVVDIWVLEQSLERWGALLATNALRLSLNLSATSITHQDTANEIMKLVEQAHISPGSLCFEITETSTVNSLGGAAQFMRDLRGLGCGFVIDNFGSGQSNFSYLKNLPGDYLAIDGSYVRAMTTDMANYTIVDAIHKVARAHGMMTMAKYVESEEILDALRGLGIEFAQGYHVGRSFPASELDPAKHHGSNNPSDEARMN